MTLTPAEAKDDDEDDYWIEECEECGEPFNTDSNDPAPGICLRCFMEAMNVPDKVKEIVNSARERRKERTP